MADEEQNIFGVPAIPARQLSASLSATANGIELILSGIAVTPTMVRFSLRPAIQGGEMIHINFDKMALTVDGWSSADGGFNASAGGDGERGITCQLGVNLYEKQGEWQLEVAEVTAVELDRHWGEWANPGSNWQPPARREITGPWVFRFTLPPSTKGGFAIL